MQQFAASGVAAYHGEQRVRFALVTDVVALPSAATTMVPAIGFTGFGAVDTQGVIGAFNVSGDGHIFYQFSIPILSGGTGGDVTVRLTRDGSTFETWIQTVLANSRIPVTGMNYDLLHPTNVLTLTITHSNGSGWSVADNGFFMAEMVVPS